MENEDPSEEQPSKPAPLKTSVLQPTDAQDVTVEYTPEPRPLPEGKQIHPRRPMPRVPDAPSESKPGGTPPADTGDPSSG